MYDIRCTVIENEFCKHAKGEYIIGRYTPANMCASAFITLWPFVTAMRFSGKTAFENQNGEVILSCPDGWVRFRLSRLAGGL